MRRLAIAAVLVGLIGVVAATGTTATASAAPRPLALPLGFTASNVASVSSPTAVEAMPDGSVVVLQQGGEVRTLVNGTLNPALALDLAVCLGAERGLLGFTPDPEFTSNRFVYVYYTRTKAGAPGGCVNRVSRFTMPTATAIDAGSELVLIDDISSVNGNHNAGDLDFGKDGYLYISTGDAGSDPRGDSSPNDAAQDLSLLNGKILRVDKATGNAPASNPLVAGGAVDCSHRGNLASTPTTPCAEIYAWGLRNPYRFAFDPNSATTRFFINDVGQSTREEVDDGGIGRNYGWPMREGSCPRGESPPCAGPAAGLTDPITDYGRTIGTYVTGGAFIPNGLWGAEYDGGYLFADGGTGKIFLRRADGSVDYANPFHTGGGQIADLAFVREGSATVLYFTVAGTTTNSVRRIVGPATPPPSGALRYVSLSPGTRVLDTREASGGAAPLPARVARDVPVGVDGAVTRAVLVNLAYVQPAGDGFLTAWAAGAPMPGTANVNARAGEVVSNLAIVPVNAAGAIALYSLTASHVVVDLLGRFDLAGGAVNAGRFVAVDPLRLADTREPVSVANAYTEHGGSPYARTAVPVLGRGGIPTTGVASVVLIVTALSGAAADGGFVTATPGGAAWPGTANLNINGSDDIRPNTVVVPVGSNGAIDLHQLRVQDVVVDVAGYFTDASAPSSQSGLFVSLAPTREADTRIGLGFTRFGAGDTRLLDPASVPADAAGLSHTIAIVDNAAPGFVTPFPGGARPLVAAGNATAPGQIRSIATFTKLSSSGTMSYFSFMPTDLVVDVTGYFRP